LEVLAFTLTHDEGTSNLSHDEGANNLPHEAERGLVMQKIPDAVIKSMSTTTTTLVTATSKTLPVYQSKKWSAFESATPPHPSAATTKKSVSTELVVYHHPHHLSATKRFECVT
jgi:hypothetical protein